jgi:hypothetical protein
MTDNTTAADGWDGAEGDEPGDTPLLAGGWKAAAVWKAAHDALETSFAIDPPPPCEAAHPVVERRTTEPTAPTARQMADGIGRACDELKEMLLAKNASYGNSVARPGIISSRQPCHARQGPDRRQVASSVGRPRVRPGRH